MSQFTSSHWALPRRRVLAGKRLFAACLGAAGWVSLTGCSGGGGEENPRPTVLTPTIRTAQEVIEERMMTPVTPPVMMGPPPTPAGVADADGFISGPPMECTGPDVARGILGIAAPTDGLLLPFDTYLATGNWGAGRPITGGTSLYQGAADSAITQSPVAGALQLRANVAAGGYTGIVFWFAPCVNASTFDGVEFTATGELSGASMIVKAQTSPDYPIDATNSKGKCKFRVDANKFTECQQPTSTLTSLPAGPITLAWESFTGGIPVPNVDPGQLLGFELQFTCPAATTAGCALNLNLGNISFVAM